MYFVCINFTSQWGWLFCTLYDTKFVQVQNNTTSLSEVVLIHTKYKTILIISVRLIVLYFVCTILPYISEVVLFCTLYVKTVRLYCFVLCMYQFCHLSEVVLFCTLYKSILSSQWGCKTFDTSQSTKQYNLT